MDKTDYKISRAAINDAEYILTLQKLCYQREAERINDFTIPPLTQSLNELRADFDSHIFLKLLFKTTIVGSVKGELKNKRCELGRLIVHPDHQRKGFGRALMRQLEKEFPDAEYMDLFTGDKSYENIKLYESEGYTLYKRETLPGTDIKLVYMEKRL